MLDLTNVYLSAKNILKKVNAVLLELYYKNLRLFN
jgi:hypothetical protein